MLIYRVLISLFAAAVLARLALRGDADALRARLGAGPADPGRHVWLHAASNGELASARPIVAAWQAARPDLPLVVTCNSESGVALARDMGCAAALAPLDLKHAVGRFARRWGVNGHIALESELWPHRFTRVPGPVALLGARMSARTARLWARLPGLARRTLGAVKFASAQDPASRDRLRALGLPRAAEGPVVDLKAFYQSPEIASDDPAGAAFDRVRTWLAASTHEGEEEIVLDAHVRAQAARPDLALILAPRHPRRGDTVAEMIAARGLAVRRRSRGEAPAPCAVYLADTLGEMPLWYAAAGIVFVGGTLGNRGGHTPYEPAAFGAALLHGPDTRNFAAPFAALAAADAARPVREAADLAAALTDLADPERQCEAGRAAQHALRPVAGPETLVAALLATFEGDARNAAAH
ncbi:3-deoxy-D-manno-octulosonic acid transferase [Roseivivax jejudonensis]|uniref:3-deoxy-D-manno-octulosonic acid transferase n=1 Tax=Roseivivax jejudonensis TaxID=1529041 RepID=A0A1X6ZDK2_9RHOB|nr:glycosyltransferase N-terminal domain-containing protein [Roseivivax jejudonensis]SLN48267.1 3-deoxy-D-manno-octulosonic acid transferase [Roseivivax jejudonensis]